MNKKLIAIAVASVMAAPAAMADMKISGMVAQDFTILSDDTVADDVRGISDSGFTRLQFDGTSGDAYARIALDERLGRDDNTADSYMKTKRDSYVGYKFGGGMSVQAGRMAGVAKNLEKDPYIATFLEIRSTAASSYTDVKFGSSSFIDGVVQLKMKAGAGNLAVQFGPAEYANDNNGHIGVAFTGKGAGINYYASYNNGSADGDSTNPLGYPSQSNIKLGGNMKFGSVKVGLMYTSMDTDGAGGATDSIFVDGNFDLGNSLSANVGFGTRTGDVAADDATLLRLAVMKKLNKGASVYAGFTSTANDTANTDTSEMGVGMVVKF